ncbi:MAG: hypothetical protein AMXMBFR58_02340 [Phycisphaerae bacterium]
MLTPFQGRFITAAAACMVAAMPLAPAARAQSTQPNEKAVRLAPGEVDLRPRFRVGDELKYVMTLENDGSTQIPPLEPSSQTSRQQIEFRLKTISTDPEKGSVVELIYDSLRVSLEAGDQKVEFDSRKQSPARKQNQKPARATDPDPLGEPADPAESLTDALAPIAGSKLTLTIDPDGTITQVTGGSELAAALVGRYAGPIADPQGVKDLFGPIFSLRKAKPSAAPGEKWQHVDRLEFPMLGKLRLTTDYTLKSASRGKATVDFRGTMDLDTETGVQDQSIKLKDTRYEGSYIWDTEAGALDSMQQVQKFTLDGEMQGATVKITSNGRVKIERQRR